MTILDLIKKSAVMLNIAEVLQDDKLNSITTENEKEVLSSNFALTRLFEFSKVMLNEIASYYLPIVKTVECETTNQQIDLNVCPNLSRIIGIKNHNTFVRYKIEDGVIKVKNDGVYTVIYNHQPKLESVFDSIEIFDEDIGEDVLINGLNSYYCLATGLFEEFNVYNDQYISKLSKLKNLRVFALPCRGWSV